MKKFSLLLLTAILLSACKKDNDSPTGTKADLLTSHNWKLTARSITVAVAGSTTTNNTIDACNQDDSYKFNTDKTLVIDAGATKCDPSDPQQETGTWAFSNNEQNLTLNSPTLPIPGDFQIKELSATTLRLYISQSLGGITYTADVTFAPR